MYTNFSAPSMILVIASISTSLPWGQKGGGDEDKYNEACGENSKGLSAFKSVSNFGGHLKS